MVLQKVGVNFMDGTHKKGRNIKEKLSYSQGPKETAEFSYFSYNKESWVGEFNTTKVYLEQEGHEQVSAHPIRQNFVNVCQNGSIIKSRNVAKGYKI